MHLALLLATASLTASAQPATESGSTTLTRTPPGSVVQRTWDDPATRERVCTAVSRWLGVALDQTQPSTIDMVTTTDGRWAFASFVTAASPAWKLQLRQVVFPLSDTRSLNPLDLEVLIRCDDEALLGVRSGWPHTALGVDVKPKPSAVFLDYLGGDEWHGPAVTTKHSLRDVLAHLARHGGFGAADFLVANAVNEVTHPSVEPGRLYLSCWRSDLGPGPRWSIEHARLADNGSTMLGMDTARAGAHRVVSNSRTYVVDSILAGGCYTNAPAPDVFITTADGITEERNWYDDTHPPPFGLAAPPKPVETTPPPRDSPATPPAPAAPPPK